MMPRKHDPSLNLMSVSARTISGDGPSPNPGNLAKPAGKPPTDTRSHLSAGGLMVAADLLATSADLGPQADPGSARTAEHEALQAQKDRIEQDLHATRQKLAELTLEHETLLRVFRQQITTTARTVRELTNERNVLQHHLENIFKSPSWRLTAPLRLAKAQFKRLWGSQGR
jgi:hypothetical protein